MHRCAGPKGPKGAKGEVKQARRAANLTFNDICREQIPSNVKDCASFDDICREKISSNVTDCANFGREGDK